jgi:hypothetical protein
MLIETKFRWALRHSHRINCSPAKRIFQKTFANSLSVPAANVIQLPSKKNPAVVTWCHWQKIMINTTTVVKVNRLRKSAGERPRASGRLGRKTVPHNKVSRPAREVPALVANEVMPPRFRQGEVTPPLPARIPPRAKLRPGRTRQDTGKEKIVES